MALEGDREVNHGRIRCGPVPVLDTGLDEDDVAGDDVSPVAVTVEDLPGAAGDDENLAAVMGMPVGARARREGDAVDQDPVGLR